MIERRAVLKTLAGLPLAAVLADAQIARAAASTTVPFKIHTKSGREVTGALARPERTPAPVVVLVHEWWGLNDQIKTMAVALAEQGFLVVAIDLFGGHVAATPDEARGLVASVVPEEAEATLTAWLDWARHHPQGTGRIGLMGWCFGGGWALNGAVLAPVDATVIYYGKCDLPAERLARLAGPVIGHFGTRDPNINQDMVGRFEAAMKEAGKPYQVFWYEAGHAFANPTGQNYDKADAQQAWQRTTDFLTRTLISG